MHWIVFVKKFHILWPKSLFNTWKLFFSRQVQEQMRQLNQQIQMLVEESAARRKLRQISGGPGPEEAVGLPQQGHGPVHVLCWCPPSPRLHWHAQRSRVEVQEVRHQEDLHPARGKVGRSPAGRKSTEKDISASTSAEKAATNKKSNNKKSQAANSDSSSDNSNSSSDSKSSDSDSNSDNENEISEWKPTDNKSSSSNSSSIKPSSVPSVPAPSQDSTKQIW